MSQALVTGQVVMYPEIQDPMHTDVNEFYESEHDLDQSDGDFDYYEEYADFNRQDEEDRAYADRDRAFDREDDLENVENDDPDAYLRSHTADLQKMLKGVRLSELDPDMPQPGEKTQRQSIDEASEAKIKKDKRIARAEADAAERDKRVKDQMIAWYASVDRQIRDEQHKGPRLCHCVEYILRTTFHDEKAPLRRKGEYVSQLLGLQMYQLQFYTKSPHRPYFISLKEWFASSQHQNFLREHTHKGQFKTHIYNTLLNAKNQQRQFLLEEVQIEVLELLLIQGKMIDTSSYQKFS